MYKLPLYETSRFFPIIPHMPLLVLPATSDSVDPSMAPTLHLDLPRCEVDNLYIWLLHTLWHQDAEFAIMPPALRHLCLVPWEIGMEQVPKLWQNITYIMWKAGAPDQKVSLVLTIVTTNCKEYNSKKIVVGISNEALIKYPESKLDKDGTEDDVVDEVDGIENLQDLIANDENDDDDENVNKNVWQTAFMVANKTDDSSFRSGTEESSRIEALSGVGM